MPWSSSKPIARTHANGNPFRRGFLVLCVLWLLCVPGFVQPAPEQKQITVYTPQTSYSLPVVGQNGVSYVGLAELLEPLGSIDAKLDGKNWKLRFSQDRQARFTIGSSRARVANREVGLSAPFQAVNGRGLVPLHSLATVLTHLMPKRALVFHEQARRLFLDKTELRYTAELRRNAPSQLVLTFTAPVNPFIATEPGRLRMVFRREPLVPGSAGENMTFGDSLIPALNYSEANGAAELTVHCTTPLIASFSDDRKTVTLTTPRPAVAQAAPQAEVGNRTGAARPIPPFSPPPIRVPSPTVRSVVVIDAAHGGSDPGGTITDKLTEKDLTLALARRLLRELASRGIPARLLRDGDSTLTADQRGVLANAAAPALFVTLHASASGNGVHLFTAPLSPVPAVRPTAFLPWDTAQAAYVRTSQTVVHEFATELLKRDIPTLNLPVSVRPLNYVAAPAIAVEISPPAGRSAEELNTAAYQQLVCGALAEGIADSRAKIQPGGAGR